jgi:uncharacterized membrane protein
MTISPKALTTMALALAIGFVSSASAQTRHSTSNKSLKTLSGAQARAAPLRGPSEDEKRWMDRASASSSAGGGGGAGGGAGGGGM